MASAGLLIIRLVVGLTMIGHGAQKLFGWFGGGGLEKTGTGFDSMGLKPGKFIAVTTGLGEFIGGILLALGLLTFVGSLLITIIMIGAVLTVHIKNGFWSSNGGFEYQFTIIVVAIGIALTGAGSYSIDTLIF